MSKLFLKTYLLIYSFLVEVVKYRKGHLVWIILCHCPCDSTSFVEPLYLMFFRKTITSPSVRRVDLTTRRSRRLVDVCTTVV